MVGGLTAPHYDPLWGEEFLVGTKKTEIKANPYVETSNKDAEIERLKLELEVMKEAEKLTLESEMANLQDLSNRSSLMAMPFSERTHTTVYLYKELGDRMGPFHPDNAKDIMQRWAKRGYRLYTRPRTPEQIEEYKKSDIYKIRLKERADQKKKHGRYKGKKGMEDIAKQIAIETGKAVVNEIRNDKVSNR